MTIRDFGHETPANDPSKLSLLKALRGDTRLVPTQRFDNRDVNIIGAGNTDLQPNLDMRVQVTLNAVAGDLVQLTNDGDDDKDFYRIENEAYQAFHVFLNPDPDTNAVGTVSRHLTSPFLGWEFQGQGLNGGWDILTKPDSGTVTTLRTGVSGAFMLATHRRPAVNEVDYYIDGEFETTETLSGANTEIADWFFEVAQEGADASRSSEFFMRDHLLLEIKT